MKFILEHSAAVTFAQHRDYMRGLPFYGRKGDFNFVTSKSKFTPGISIKILPLSDLSKNADLPINEFSNYISKLKMFFKPGDRVRGIRVNSQFDRTDENYDGEEIVGKFQRFEVDHTNERVRIFAKDPETLEEFELYPDTMERIFESESQALDFIKDNSELICEANAIEIPIENTAKQSFVKTFKDFCI